VPADREERALSEAFCAAASRADLSDEQHAELGAALRSAATEAASTWPSIGMKPEQFARFVGERVAATEDPVVALGLLRLDELYLCCACLSGSAAAIAELERGFVSEAARALSRLGLSPHEREDALQHARAKLLAGGEDRKPKLAQFSGQGSLAGWLRVVIVRSALNARRAERRHASRDDDMLAERIAGEAEDPELDVVRARYADSLAEAVSKAFRGLTSEQRNLLRLYVIDGLTLGELGRMHSVDASTISRWLARIRAKLLADARNHLLARHALRPSECDSVMRVVRSGLFVTVERLLRTEPSETSGG
jgi:RNA polymerase sigma-70 factor, ECF subfamily